MEEFYLLVDQFISLEVNIILFEGEGQGETLKQGMYFHEKWEDSIGAVLDHYHLNDVILMGISWGGFFALRAAAIDKRIKHVIAHGVLYDGLDVQLQLVKQPARTGFRLLFHLKCKKIINLLAQIKMKKDPLAKWGLTHGMYITNTKTPYDYLQAIKKHHLGGVLNKINQNILLLTGEKDHYIPRWQYHYLKKHLPNARHIESRMFMEGEGGEQHCQVGNYDLAINYIKQWIKKL